MNICRWLLLFQEYDYEIIVNPSRLNVGTDDLSCIDNGEEPTSLEDGLLDAQIFSINVVDEHFADIIQLITTRSALVEYSL